MSFRDSLTVYCADVGSIRENNFGWARGADQGVNQTGRDIRDLTGSIADDLAADRPVALGFECPLFVPVRDDPLELTSKRRGEGNRPWSAGAGIGSLMVGLVESVWLLRSARDRLGDTAPVFLEWNAFEAAGSGLYLWEAFVTGEAKTSIQGSQAHAEDAATAVKSFLEALPEPESTNAVSEENVYSLIGAALLRTGWSTDLKLLSTPCLVIRS